MVVIELDHRIESRARHCPVVVVGKAVHRRRWRTIVLRGIRQHDLGQVVQRSHFPRMACGQRLQNVPGIVAAVIVDRHDLVVVRDVAFNRFPKKFGPVADAHHRADTRRPRGVQFAGRKRELFA